MAEITIKDLAARVEALEAEKAVTDARFEALEEQSNEAAEAAKAAEPKPKTLVIEVGKKKYNPIRPTIKVSTKDGLLVHDLATADQATLSKLVKDYPHKFKEI